MGVGELNHWLRVMTLGSALRMTLGSGRWTVVREKDEGEKRFERVTKSFAHHGRTASLTIVGKGTLTMACGSSVNEKR